MAHLHCLAHKRRILTFKDAVGHVIIVHRSEDHNSDCDTRYVRIGRYTYDPARPAESSDFDNHSVGLGAFVSSEPINPDQARPAAKPKRMTRKQRERKRVAATLH
jgi:hypothetical protein